MQPVVPMPTRTRTQRDAAAAAADEEMSEISPDGTDWFIVGECATVRDCVPSPPRDLTSRF